MKGFAGLSSLGQSGSLSKPSLRADRKVQRLQASRARRGWHPIVRTLTDAMVQASDEQILILQSSVCTLLSQRAHDLFQESGSDRDVYRD